MSTPARLKAQEIPQRDPFRYIGLIISEDEEIEKDVAHRIRELNGLK